MTSGCAWLFCWVLDRPCEITGKVIPYYKIYIKNSSIHDLIGGGSPSNPRGGRIVVARARHRNGAELFHMTYCRAALGFGVAATGRAKAARRRASNWDETCSAMRDTRLRWRAGSRTSAFPTRWLVRARLARELHRLRDYKGGLRRSVLQHRIVKVRVDRGCTSSEPFGQKGLGSKRVTGSSGFLQTTLF